MSDSNLTPIGRVQRLAKEAEEVEEIFSELDASPTTKRRIAEAVTSVKEAEMSLQIDIENERTRSN